MAVKNSQEQSKEGNRRDLGKIFFSSQVQVLGAINRSSTRRIPVAYL